MKGTLTTVIAIGDEVAEYRTYFAKRNIGSGAIIPTLATVRPLKGTLTTVIAIGDEVAGTARTSPRRAISSGRCQAFRPTKNSSNGWLRSASKVDDAKG